MAYDKTDSRLLLQEKLGAGDSSILTTSLSSEDDKRKGRKPKYPDPKPGYRSGYSVNRSFTQAEIILLKQILKEAGDPPVDMLTQRSWSQHDDDSRNDMQSSNGEHNARRKRTRNVTTPYQTRVLRKVLSVTSFPSTEMREALANSLNMHPRTVQIWFQNQRQKAKNSPTNLASGIPHLDNYGTSDIFPIPLAPNNASGLFFHNMSMMANNNSSTNISPNVTPQSVSSSMPQQNLLPPSPPYTIVPIYQTPTPTYPSTIYLSSATLQFQNYQNGNTNYHPSPEVSPQVPQQGFNSPTGGANGTAGQYVQNPTLDMLAAAALEAENGHPPPQGNHSRINRGHINGGHVSHHAHPHHQHQGQSPTGSSHQTRHSPPSIFPSKASPIDASNDAVSPMCTSPIVHGLRPW